MFDTVLFVDDEKDILNSIDGIFSKASVTVVKAANPRDALEIIRDRAVAVVVSDNQMPEMRGLDLLAHIRGLSPDTLRILMTDPSDLAAAVNAVNNGELFRFVTKPLDNKFFTKTVQEAVHRFNVIHQLREGDETAYLAVARDVELKDPFTSGHAERVAEYAALLAESFNLAPDMKRAIILGSYIHDCGKLQVPEAILNKHDRLSKDEYEIVKNHPRWGADIAVQAGLHKSIISIIHYHHERFDGSGYPSGMKGDDVPFEAQIVAVADVFDALTSDRCYRTKFSTEKSVEILSLMRGNVFNPEIIDRFINECLPGRVKSFPINLQNSPT